MSSIFGNFGAANTQGAATGQAAAPAAGSTNIFGSTPAAGTNTPTTQPAATGLGIFSVGGTTSTPATNPQQPAASTSLFGNANTTGQPSTASQLFGKPAGAFGALGQTTQPAATGTSIFGNTGATATQPATGTIGSSIFGNTGAAQAAPAATTNPAPTGSIFGTTAPAANTNPLFGGSTAQNNTTTTTNPLFGGSTALNATSTAPNPLFGGAATQNAPATTGSSIFGGSTTQTTNPLFGGSTTQNAAQNPLFGGGTALTTNNTLGSSAMNTLGASALTRPTTTGFGGMASILGAKSGTPQSQADAQLQSARLTAKIEAIVNAWNPQSPQCRFYRIFYNLVDPNQAHLYGRPTNILNDAIWQKAVRENPDPACLVPVVALGFDELKARADAQTTHANAQTERLKDIQTRLANVSEKHTSSTIPRLARFQAKQHELTRKTLALAQHLHLLIPAIRSSSIRPEEEELCKKLELIEQEIKGKGRAKAKLAELWAVLGAVKARDQPMLGGSEWKVVDDDGLARIAQVLSEQQAGLTHLTKILQRALKDLEIIVGRRNAGPISAANTDSESLFDLGNATAKLRASGFR